LIVTGFYLHLPEFLHFFFALIASIHTTQVIIILLIKTIFGLHTLIFKREKFYVRNSPLNKYATIISQAIYCLKVGCATTAAGASFLAGGMAYDSLLVEAGRERVFMPMMGAVYKGVFGELPQIQGNNQSGGTNPIPETTNKGVLELVKEYQKMTAEERNQFMADINKSVAEQRREIDEKKNN